MTWLLRYALTLLIEIPIAAALVPREMRRRMLVDAFLLNTLTHPLLTVALRWEGVEFWPGEVLVLLAEALGYHLVTGLRPGRALLVSTICNGITVAVALIIGS